MVYLVWAICWTVAQQAGDDLGAPKPLRVIGIAERIELVEFRSAALGAEKRVCVVLPAGYERSHSTRWPVLVLLHGRGRNERTLIDDERCRQVLLKAEFVIVMPQGDDGWYVDSPVLRRSRYGTYMKEVILLADSSYRLSRCARRRAIAGWSMGGYGAVRVAQTSPEQFGFVCSIIGLLDFPRLGLPRGQSYPVPVERFGRDPEQWRRLNPIHFVPRLKGKKVLLIAAEEAFDRTMNENFAKELQRHGIDTDWVLLPGGHTFDVVRRALPVLIERVGKFFKEEPGRNASDAEQRGY